MKRLLIPAAVLVAAVAIAACGSDSSDSSGSSAAAAGGDTVAVKSIDGVGNVLVDSSGKALYASDVEADGTVRCVDGCTSFWEPLTVDSGTPTGSGDVGKLGVVKRPDGARQVTANGKLLYTFSEDGAGEVEGNGFSDDFNGKKFTWSAVLAGGKLASGSGGSSDSSGSGGEYDSGGSDDSGGGGYGY
jgi:predicted lipoprotein with Yx(FWY)xxD motif